MVKSNYEDMLIAYIGMEPTKWEPIPDMIEVIVVIWDVIQGLGSC